MTPFCATVVGHLKKSSLGSLSSGELLRLIDPKKKQHQSAIAMNLVRLAWKGEYVTCYIRGERERVFMLTAAGAAS